MVIFKFHTLLLEANCVTTSRPCLRWGYFSHLSPLFLYQEWRLMAIILYLYFTPVPPPQNPAFWKGTMELKQFNLSSIFFFFLILFFGCVGSSLLHAGFSCCGAWALGTRASVVVTRGLSSCGSRA